MEVFLVVGAVVIFLVVSRRGFKQTPAPPPETNKPFLRPRSIKHSRRFHKQTAPNVPVAKSISGPAYIIDGDSIVIQKTQIRLFGVDAPELNHPHGKNAKWALVGLCKGEIVRAEIVERDVHGRCVARCYLGDGRDLSAEMVKLGLAIDWPKFSSGAYCKLEQPDLRKKLWLADARQKGRMHVWERFDQRRQRETKRDT